MKVNSGFQHQENPTNDRSFIKVRYNCCLLPNFDFEEAKSLKLCYIIIIININLLRENASFFRKQLFIVFCLKSRFPSL
jgi:hypothetical protein